MRDETRTSVRVGSSDAWNTPLLCFANISIMFVVSEIACVNIMVVDRFLNM